MEKMDQYPEPEGEVPDPLHPTQTSRILTPGIVLAAVGILAASSITGIVVAASIFDSASPYKSGESVTQVFVLISSVISILYILLHLFVTLKNEPIGIVRPPEDRVRGYCFIAARLALVAWMIALIASSTVASKPNICLRWNRDCKLQVLDVVGSSLAFLSAGVILTSLESCQYPFQIPAFLHIPQTITCRVSSFGSEFFDRSTRTSVHDDEGVFADIQYLSAMEQATIRKPLPKPSIPGAFPQDVPITSPPMAKTARGWGAAWTHLVQDTSITRTNSSGSISSSSTSTWSRSSDTPGSKRAANRTVTPSSSISNLSRRSPLSTMRSIESPDVALTAQVRYLPPVIAPAYEWNHSKTASLTQLLPVAKVHSPRRRSGTPAAFKRKPFAIAPPEFAPKRTTLDVKIPGAFIDYHPNYEDQMKIEEHAPIIEQESDVSIRAECKPKGLVRVPAGEFEKHYGVNTLDSRSRYRQPNQASSLVQSAGTCAASPGVVKVEDVKPSKSEGKKKAKQFRRLTLGDISSELGKLWDD